VADHLGLDHHVFNFGPDFDRRVVEPYVAAHADGRTPNPCIECNRHLKFDRLLDRARALGFDAIATGHHARVVERADGTRRVARGADTAKDQSYVLHMLDQEALAQVLLPVGSMTKADVRRRADALGLRTAAKPDSQDVCFIQAGPGRRGFLGDRLDLTPARVVDGEGRRIGSVDAVELVTVGQRRGLGIEGTRNEPRFVTAVDVRSATVTVGRREDLLVDETLLADLVWADGPVTGLVQVQCSAHGEVRQGVLGDDRVVWTEPQPMVAPGQSVVVYDGDEVVGGGIAR
jgi:tRNA-specific 2-thiouridylase